MDKVYATSREKFFQERELVAKDSLITRRPLLINVVTV